MGLGGVISNLLSLGAKLLPAVRDTTLQGSSSSSASLPPVDESQKIETELKALMRMLERIKATLYDAEQREIRDKSVELWLKELKGVAYDAEDVLDEYRYEILRAQVEAREASMPDSRKRKLISFPDGMLDQIQHIKCRFEEIANHRVALRLLEEDGPMHSSNEQRAQTSHLVDESGIFGREKEKKKLISMLSSQCNGGEVISVVTIVGTGGLGKTTLAQLVYKELKARQVFDEFGWVCVSEDFNVERLTREMIESITRRTCSFTNLSALQEEVVEVIRRKRVLLILDDVWNENRKHWETFKVPFKSAASVKVLITTRSKLVAEIMRTDQTFNLSRLSEEQCWSLFEHYAFASGDDQCVGSNFKEIGKQIMKKCGMLPLAVKSIASLLRYEMDEDSWREILESELWKTDASNAIFPPLQLSFACLPTYLKPCLILCSTFPKDYEFDLLELVELWISQGYIESKGNKSAKKIGFEYGKQLWQRSFFEGSHWISRSGREYFKLHDLIHDLARLNSKNGCFSIGDGSSSKLPDFSYELYNLYIGGFKKIIEPIPLVNFKTLRTLIIVDQGVEIFLAPDLSFPPKLRALRIDFWTTNEFKFICHDHKFKFLSPIDNLKHLRYLSLRHLVFKRIPESICSLYNLQNLKFWSCSFNELPKSIGKLISLETLELSNCDLLKWLPESLCELKALRNLKIKSCEQFQMLPSCMGNLVSLETLEILSCYLLEWLPESLCKLRALRKLKVVYCTQIQKLPPDMGNLASLEKLEIKGCVLLERLPESFCQLKTLRKLYLKLNGPEALIPNDMGSLTNLQSIHLDCKKIGWLRNFPNLGRSVCLEGLKNVSDLTDVQCANLVSMHNLESLKLQWAGGASAEAGISLGIMKGHGIYLEDHCEVMATLQPHPNLRDLKIHDYGGSTFPEWIGNPSSCASLETLEIVNCIKLRFLPSGSLHKLKYLTIRLCHSLQIIRAEFLPPELQELCISDCRELISVPGIQGLKSLVKLSIYRCYNLQILFMDAEHSLELTMRTNESSYQNSLLGLSNLTSLRSLSIGRCRKLQLLTDELLCVDSCEVQVGDCPLLKEWCLQHGINYKD